MRSSASQDRRLQKSVTARGFHARCSGSLAARDSLRQTERLDFREPKNARKETVSGECSPSRQVRTAVAKAGIQERVGWHTFRRSISTWLIENEENVKVTQELLRHANSKTTLDLYAKAATPSKRRAHEKIVNDLLAAQQRMAGIQAHSYASAESIVG